MNTPTIKQALLSSAKFWFCLLSLISILNAILIIEILPEISFFALLAGYFLQFLLLLPVIALEGAILLSLPDNKLRSIIHFIFRLICLALLGMHFFSSMIIYSGIGVFVSFEVIKIFFMDFGHIASVLAATAAIPIMVFIIFLSLVLMVSGLIAKKAPKLLHKLTELGVYAACIGVITSLVFAVAIHGNTSAQIALYKNSFPPTFLIGQFVEYISSQDDSAEPLNIANLPPQISIEEYKAKAGPIKKKHPVIFIMLESISHNHMSFTGYHRTDITPNLDKLFSESVFFDRTYTPSNHSNLAQGSILSSQYSLRRIRLETFQEINYPKPMLFDILHAYGYETAIYSAQDENWLGMRRFIESNDAKIDHFKHALDFPQYYQFFDRKIDDADLIKEVDNYLTNIRDKDKPQHLYINLQRTHYDYRLLPDYPGYYGEADSPLSGTFFNYGLRQKDKARLLFDNALQYVDIQIGVLMDIFKAQGFYDEAIIIVSADHGEAFFEHGYPTHATSMYDPQIRTFTSVKLPKTWNEDGEAIEPKTEKRFDAISSLDIMPMALEALGLPNHPAFQGYQLLNKTRNDSQPIFSTGQSLIRADVVVQQPWKYFISEKEGAVLINMETDPLERLNVIEDFPQVKEMMHKKLMTYRQHQTDYYIEYDQSVRDGYFAPKYQ